MDRKLLVHKIWRKAFGEPSRVNKFGSFREKEKTGLIARSNYAYGMLRAADVARYFGKSSVTVCEFGVAHGAGLLNMIELARVIGDETGVHFRVVGFDTGKGLLPPQGFKDHPELWNVGDFKMEDVSALKARIGDRAELIIGDIADTIDAFRGSLTDDCPLGFVSIDVDVYSGAVSALKVLTGAAHLYLPAISFYFDDTQSFFSNAACGELLAIAEYNASHATRPLERDHSLPGSRYFKSEGWYAAMYVCHILDHVHRNEERQRAALDIKKHLEFIGYLQ